MMYSYTGNVNRSPYLLNSGR